MRRRRRFVKNPNGTSHLDSALKSSFDQNTDAINNKDDLLKQLNNQNGTNGQRFISPDFSNNFGSANSQEHSHVNEVELEQELTGPIHYTTKCKLVCSVCVVNGTLSITSNELYFEVDENDNTFKKLDQNVIRLIKLKIKNKIK